MKRSNRKRPLAILLAVVLLIGAVTTGAYSAAVSGDNPTLTAVAVGVDGFVEVGLNVQPNGQTFRSAGMVLSYDADKLTPVDWSGGDVTLGGTNWDTATPLPAKGPDELSGKTALAYQVSSTGYLYLLAEAPQRLTDYTQALPDATTEGATASGLPILTPADTTPAPTPTPEATEAPEVTPTPEGREGADTEDATDPADTTDDPTTSDAALRVEQAVVVRFKVASGTAAEAIKTIDLVTGDVAQASYLNSTAGYAYYPGAAADRPQDAGKSVAAALQLLRVEKGTTYSTGTGGGGSTGPTGTDGIVAVTCFDWDDTMLGTFIFRTNDDPKVQQANADAAIEEFKKQKVTVKQKNKDTGEIEDVELTIAEVLTSHPGYDFLAWVKNEDDVPSSYGYRTASYARNELPILKLDDADKIDLSTIKTSTTAKAAYDTNGKIEIGAKESGAANKAAARRYKTRVVGYGRFGTTQNFSITIEVFRDNVPRVTNGYLWVRMNVDDGSKDGVDVYNRYPLTGADVETVQVALYASPNAKTKTVSGVNLVEWTVIDSYEYENWVNAGTNGERTNRSECQAVAGFEVRPVGSTAEATVWNDNAYPRAGMIWDLYSQLQELAEMETPDTKSLNMNTAQIRTLGINPLSGGNNALKEALYKNWIKLKKPDLTKENGCEIIALMASKSELTDEDIAAAGFK